MLVGSLLVLFSPLWLFVLVTEMLFVHSLDDSFDGGVVAGAVVVGLGDGAGGGVLSVWVGAGIGVLWVLVGADDDDSLVVLFGGYLVPPGDSCSLCSLRVD